MSLRLPLQVATFLGDQQTVTSLSCSHDSSQLAVGYRDGTVRIFDVTTGDCTVTFNGHRTHVSTLSYDKHSMRLVSGGLVCSHRSCSLFHNWKFLLIKIKWAVNLIQEISTQATLIVGESRESIFLFQQLSKALKGKCGHLP